MLVFQILNEKKQLIGKYLRSKCWPSKITRTFIVLKIALESHGLPNVRRNQYRKNGQRLKQKNCFRKRRFHAFPRGVLESRKKSFSDRRRIDKPEPERRARTNERALRPRRLPEKRPRKKRNETRRKTPTAGDVFILAVPPRTHRIVIIIYLRTPPAGRRKYGFVSLSARSFSNNYCFSSIRWIFFFFTTDPIIVTTVFGVIGYRVVASLFLSRHGRHRRYVLRSTDAFERSSSSSSSSTGRYR